ncbi:MAG TPA: Rieske 2Fe-2S domain-containing protein [Mycobacterium sp.]
MTIDDLAAPGQARSPGVSVQDVLRKEAECQTVPQVLLGESYEYLGSEDLPVERYVSEEYARLEAERLWPKVWQMACREEEIPQVGDYHVYEIATYSILVVRVAEDQIKAYHNSCLHRGTQLKDVSGSAPFIRCPFHGWTWNLERHRQEDHHRVGLPPRGQGEVLPTRMPGRQLGRVRVHQHGPRRRTAE